MNVATMDFTLDERDPVRMWVSRSAAEACLVLDAEGTYCEIRLNRVHVDALREQLPAVLAGLDRWTTEDAGRRKAETAGRHVVDTAAQAKALAVRADQADDYNLAASLRAAAAEATAKGTAVDASVRAFESAAMAADHAAEMLERAISEADAALRRRGRDDQAASTPDNV